MGHGGWVVDCGVGVGWSGSVQLFIAGPRQKSPWSAPQIEFKFVNVPSHVWQTVERRFFGGATNGRRWVAVGVGVAVQLFNCLGDLGNCSECHTKSVPMQRHLEGKKDTSDRYKNNGNIPFCVLM